VSDTVGFDLPNTQDRLSKDGYAYLNGIPDGFDYPKELARIGPLLPQYAGELVRDVKPDPTVDDGVISAYGISELTPHTEWYEFSSLPPRYVALWCVHPADGPGGETTLADGYRLLDTFAPDERKRMFVDMYDWASRGLAHEGVQHVSRHPILQLHSDTLVVRFSTLDLRRNDDLSSRYVTHGVRFFEANHVAIRIERGAILIWDNWRMLHARNTFSDRRRHLQRVLIGARGA